MLARDQAEAARMANVIDRGKLRLAASDHGWLAADPRWPAVLEPLV